MKVLTKEAVARQFFHDFMENLGSEYECEQGQFWQDEECNMILINEFFSGTLEIRWDPQEHSLMFRSTYSAQTYGEKR